MLKIMIVDDEFYFREALKVSLPWEELGFELCGEAKNGKDALEKVEEWKPEIILVDINMPIMDGLEFVQSLREKGINSKIIILTGHSEFNYAKQAVQLGVNNYILKPVNEAELQKSLSNLKKIIEWEAGVRIEMEGLKRQVRESLPLLKDKLLNELIRGSFIRKRGEAIRRMESLGIHVSSKRYRVVALEPDLEEVPGLEEEDRQLWKFAVSNISGEILSEQFSFDLFHDMEDRICFILGQDEEKNGCDKENDSGAECGGEIDPLLENRLESIRTAVQRHLGFTVTIGIGSEKEDLFELSESYKEAVVALKSKLTMGCNRIIPYTSVSETGIPRNLFTGEHRNQLLMSMRATGGKEVLELIRQVFQEMRKANIHHEILLLVCIEMAAVCLEFMAETGLSLKENLPNSRLNVLEEIQSKKTIGEMESWVEELFRHTMEKVGRNKSKKASRLIEEVKKYVRDNYMDEELSIDEIARSLFVNYAHLSFIFKRDTGTTINEYLTEFRIKKAKELFDSGNVLVLDVAGRVGYSDANYFGKCFKKFYGLAPSKYLENIRR